MQYVAFTEFLHSLLEMMVQNWWRSTSQVWVGNSEGSSFMIISSRLIRVSTIISTPDLSFANMMSSRICRCTLVCSTLNKVLDTVDTKDCAPLEFLCSTSIRKHTDTIWWLYTSRSQPARYAQARNCNTDSFCVSVSGQLATRMAGPIILRMRGEIIQRGVFLMKKLSIWMLSSMFWGLPQAKPLTRMVMYSFAISLEFHIPSLLCWLFSSDTINCLQQFPVCTDLGSEIRIRITLCALALAVWVPLNRQGVISPITCSRLSTYASEIELRKNTSIYSSFYSPSGPQFLLPELMALICWISMPTQAFLNLLSRRVETWLRQQTSSASRLALSGWPSSVKISSSMFSVAGFLNRVYRLFAILSALLVITSILNSERGGYVILAISLSTTLAEEVFSRSFMRCSVCEYRGSSSLSPSILSISGYISSSKQVCSFIFSTQRAKHLVRELLTSASIAKIWESKNFLMASLQAFLARNCWESRLINSPSISNTPFLFSGTLIRSSRYSRMSVKQFSPYFPEKPTIFLKTTPPAEQVNLVHILTRQQSPPLMVLGVFSMYMFHTWLAVTLGISRSSSFSMQTAIMAWYRLVALSSVLLWNMQPFRILISSPSKINAAFLFLQFYSKIPLHRGSNRRSVCEIPQLLIRTLDTCIDEFRRASSSSETQQQVFSLTSLMKAQNSALRMAGMYRKVRMYPSFTCFSALSFEKMKFRHSSKQSQPWLQRIQAQACAAPVFSVVFEALLSINSKIKWKCFWESSAPILALILPIAIAAMDLISGSGSHMVVLMPVETILRQGRMSEGLRINQEMLPKT